uniref:Uncharacterized protein n=1 Tax=Moniliophthora roreri TaxID=221103 RepID=A0A0W0F6U2_MONRR
MAKPIPLELENIPVVDGKVHCPNCNKYICVGKAGKGNFANKHYLTPTCEATKLQKEKQAKLNQGRIKQQSILSLLPKVVASVLPNVQVPKPIQSLKKKGHDTPSTTSNGSASSSAQPQSMLPPPTSSVATIETTQSHHTDILEKLHTHILQLPASVPEADTHHPLAQYSKEPEKLTRCCRNVFAGLS